MNTSVYPKNRLYNIQNNVGYFYTGQLPDRHQVLMGVQMPKAVTLMFDANGNYEYTYVRDFSMHPSSDFSSGFYTRKGILKLHEEEIPRWQKEIGCSPMTIRVRRFFLPDRRIGIKEIPEHYEAESMNAYFTEPEIEEMKEELQQWYAEKSFVLWFSTDYYMNEAGDVVSS